MKAVEVSRYRKWRLNAEPVEAFGYEIERLVRLICMAYPEFPSESATVIARDVFLEGLKTEFQVHERKDIL